MFWSYVSNSLVGKWSACLFLVYPPWAHTPANIHTWLQALGKEGFYAKHVLMTLKMFVCKTVCLYFVEKGLTKSTWTWTGLINDDNLTDLTDEMTDCQEIDCKILKFEKENIDNEVTE